MMIVSGVKRGPYQYVGDFELLQIARALAVVDGNFALAARIVGISSRKMRNVIRAHSVLKKRWGNTQRGRPKGRIVIHQIDLGVDDWTRSASRFGPEFFKTWVKMLSVPEQQALSRWLTAKLAPLKSEPKPRPIQQDQAISQPPLPLAPCCVGTGCQPEPSACNQP